MSPNSGQRPDIRAAHLGVARAGDFGMARAVGDCSRMSSDRQPGCLTGEHPGKLTRRADLERDFEVLSVVPALRPT